MEILDLDIGTLLNMQSLAGVSNQRYEVQVIGYLKGEALIVSMPRDKNGALIKIFTHDEYIIRYLKGKNIFAFRSKVQHVSKLPFWHLFLEFPGEMEKVEIRQAERIGISIPAQTLVNGEKHWSTIHDISSNGAKVAINSNIGRKGEHVELFFKLTMGGIERDIHLVAIIRNTRSGLNSTTGKSEFLYGIEFVDPSEQDAVFVQGFVYEQLLTNRDAG